MDVETFLCQSRKKISFSKINLLNLGKNLVGPWGSTQLGERSPKPVSHPKSDTRKVSHPSSPQNRPTCTCSTLPRASARTPPLGPGARPSAAPRRSEIRCSLAYGRLSKINILADKPIPAERSEGPCEQSGLAAGGIAPGGMPPVDHPGGP